MVRIENNGHIHRGLLSLKKGHLSILSVGNTLELHANTISHTNIYTVYPHYHHVPMETLFHKYNSL